MSLASFQKEFKILHEKWGYHWEADPNYEDLTANDLRQFQHLTDYLMRFLAQGYVGVGDVETMFGVDFYKPPPRDAFNVTSQALKTYLKTCGPFFMEYQQKCVDAKKYLKTCPPSVERCFLTVALSWTRVVRKFVRKLYAEKDISIMEFTEKIKNAALNECEKYLNKVHRKGLVAETIEVAFTEVTQAEELRRSRSVLRAARRAEKARKARKLRLRF